MTSATSSSRYSAQEQSEEHPRSHAGTFRRFAARTSVLLGSPWAFALAALSVAIWALTGPVFGFSSNWQLIINTSTTIVTFLMVFLIQNTQNRDTMAINLKLDELLRSTREARTSLVGLEDLSDADLARLRAQFEQISAHAGDALAEDAADVLEEHLEDHLAASRQEAAAPKP